jgi:hypothetical protein
MVHSPKADFPYAISGRGAAVKAAADHCGRTLTGFH